MVNKPLVPHRFRLLAVICAVLLYFCAFGGKPYDLFISAAYAAPGSGSEGTPEDDIEEDIEDDIIDDLEDRVEDTVTDDLEDEVEAAIEDQVEDAVEDQVEDAVEDQVEAEVEDQVEAEVEDQVEAEVEDQVEAEVEDQVEAEVEDQVEDEVANSVEDDVEDKILDKSGPGNGRIEDDVDEDVEGRFDEDRSDTYEPEDETTEEESGRNRGRNRGSSNAEDDSEEESESSNSGSGSSSNDSEEQGDSENDENNEDNSGRGSNNSGKNEEEDDDDDENENDSSNGTAPSPESAVERFELGFDDEGNPVRRNEWLLLLEPDSLEALSTKGYIAKHIEDLGGLGLVLARVEPPEHRNLKQTAQEIKAVAPNAFIDYNHLYATESGDVHSGVDGGLELNAFEEFHLPNHGADKTIGLIDTRVDITHPALSNASIKMADFVPYTNAQPIEHGSAVASILVGSDSDYHGIAPKAKILAASVFFESPAGTATATTASLVAALDWLTNANVHIVNMSLAGPPNDVLEAAIHRAKERNVTIIAAVGNDGPFADPRYPAAYPDVVAVTAVNAKKKIYRLANRGDHIDFAAPGVDVVTAAQSGRYSVRSGTSFASPFVAAMLAQACDPVLGLSESKLEQFKKNAEDLGAPGHDPVYGDGYFHMIEQN